MKNNKQIIKIIEEFNKKNNVNVKIDDVSELEFYVIAMIFFDKKGFKKQQNAYLPKSVTKEIFIETLKEILNLFQKTLKENK